MAIDPVSTSAEALQFGLGLVQTLSNQSKVKRLLNQRQSYVTPEEIYKILNATEYKAQGDTQTRDYQTGELDKTFSQILGTSERLGADPNDLSALFDQKISGLMKIGEEFHQNNMQAFSQYLNALGTAAENKAAEQKSKQDLLKDKIQAASSEKAAGVQNMGNALNSFIGTQSASKTSDLYKQIAQLLSGNSSLSYANADIPDLATVAPLNTTTLTPRSSPF